MEYRRLGGSGLLVSVIELGTNNFGNRLTSSAPGESWMGRGIHPGV
jgi:aryl-alcohol dehydrogenase-like predicted oxidoreductase